MTTLVLFSDQMLRLDDHPALARARGPVLPVFVLDETRGRPLGGASRWWLKQSLEDLSRRLAARGTRLILARGAIESIVPDLARAVGAVSVHTTRAYSPAALQGEAALHAALAERQIEHKRFSGPLLFEPDQVKTKTGGPYSVFSPFWRMCLSHPEPGAPLDAPEAYEIPTIWPQSLTFDQLDLDPRPVDWAGGLRDSWQVGEEAAFARLDEFINRSIGNYKGDRDRPALDATSRLSPHLRFGEISPRRVWDRVKRATNGATDQGPEHYLRELGWREFSWHLLFHFPHMETAPLRENFKCFPWSESKDADFMRWAKGQTGFPLVDAGMRQLWQTGWMHNRVRMVVASFLVKDMLYHWRLGEAWFWDTLVDADAASNVISWQWAAGCGADAAPYFRIFNPTAQSEKFDPDGDYIRTYVRELRLLEGRAIHSPTDVPLLVLEGAGIRLGKQYPAPMLDRKAARARALAAFETVKTAAGS